MRKNFVNSASINQRSLDSLTFAVWIFPYAVVLSPLLHEPRARTEKAPAFRIARFWASKKHTENTPISGGSGMLNVHTAVIICFLARNA